MKISANSMHRFPVAPWPTLLKALSAGSCVVLLVVAWFAARGVPRDSAAHSVGSAVAWVPPAVLIGASQDPKAFVHAVQRLAP